MADRFSYSSLRWRRLARQARRRDNGRCTVALLLSGDCHGAIHVHHVRPVDDYPELAFDLDNCASVCASHHPVWESLRRSLVARLAVPEDVPPRCPHRHVSAEARALCEARLLRQRQLVA